MERKTTKKARIRLSPRSGGTIIVFNTVHQGMYQQLLRQIEEMEEEADKPDSIPIKIETFTAFGPFDNVIRFDVDDFCLVNRISSIAGVSSQQIQCAYTIWKPEPPGGNAKDHWKPFCCITQLKVQNHLMLGYGPEIEEGIAGVLAELMERYLEENPGIAGDIEIELMATLGWDEFFIFMRNSRGYASMFEPILKKIRPLTLEDLKKHMGSEFPLKLPGDTPPQEKHLFLSTYSTPGYSLELSRYIEEKIEIMRIEKGADEDFIIPANELTLDELLQDKYPDPAFIETFGSEPINVSTRLSIKPGHWPKVSRITRKVLEGTNWGFQDGVAVIERTFSIGRYDVYPWINAEMTCKEFVLTFTVLAFALAGNLKKEEDYRKFLTRTQYYNSYTVISYLDEEAHPESSIESKQIREGAFISQLGKLSLGGEKEKNILQVFRDREILRERVPNSIVIGLSRIFSLFDSCIMDRFTCDSFVDMYPFMQRVRQIIDTVEEDEKKPGNPLYYQAKDAKGDPIFIELPESWINSNTTDTLVAVFYQAIERFYRGFVHRYLSSYPMMDKNETGVDFSGRLHRILSAVTGMQNLLLDDLDCHNKKGFNSISTYPTIRIYRDSFNTTEVNVLHLFQVETFFTLFHESIHTVIHSREKKGKELLATLETPIKDLKSSLPDISEESLDILRVLLEEVTGDLLLIKNAFHGNLTLFGFWYWLMLIQCKKEIDSQLILRFLLISYEMDEKSRDIIKRYSSGGRGLSIDGPARLVELMEKMLPESSYPRGIKKSIMSRIEAFANTYINSPKGKAHFNGAFSILTEILEAIYPKLDRLLTRYGYAYDEDKDRAYKKKYFEAPLHPALPGDGDNHKRQSSSIQTLRCLLTFVYENREEVLCEGDGLLNFQPKNKSLRLDLFKYRVALINTLQWESLQWKRSLLESMGINFPPRINTSEGE